MLNNVIDISHHNGEKLDFAKAAASGIAGVIHKASQGPSYVDPMYDANRKKAQAAGLLWGAYHFGTGDDVQKQVANFLKAIGKRDNVLLVLDFEDNPQGATMSLDQARQFVTGVKQQTGTWPGFYSGSLIKNELGTNKDPTLANCWFWLAQYGPKAVVPLTWPTWTMWQYTDGNIGPKPHTVPGIGNCDRDKFNGADVQLQKLWGVS